MTAGNEMATALAADGRSADETEARCATLASAGVDHDPCTGRVRRALDYQEGGNHYKELRIQPVELTLANRLEGCEHSAIKYVTRWREKEGLKDLRKARHFLRFLFEHFDDEGRRPASGDWPMDPLRYCIANRLGYCESRVVLLVHTWAAIRRREQLVLAMQEIDRLIAMESPEAAQAETPA